MSRGLSSRYAVLVVAVAVAAFAVVDAVNPSRAIDRPEPVFAGQATSGAWYCGAGNTATGSTVDVVAASVPSPEGAPADVAMVTFEDGAVARGDSLQIFGDSSAAASVSPDRPALGVTVRWWEAPTAVTRIWDLQAVGGPSGLVAGPCEAEPSDVWVVPGMVTAGGAQANLVLANPFETDASVSISLTTPEGLLEPTLLENVVVPERSTRTVLVNEHAPERSDVGIVVRTRSGRIVAEAFQTFDAAIGGVEGVTLVKAARAPAEAWTIPWFASTPDPLEIETGDEDDEGAPADDEEASGEDGSDQDAADDEETADEEETAGQGEDQPTLEDVTGRDSLEVTAESWLWVSNIEDRPSSLILTVHSQAGGRVADIEEDLTVEPGAVKRIDLRGLLPGDLDRGALTVRSENGVPVVASVATLFTGDDEQRTGVAVQMGTPEPDPRWVLSGGATEGRASYVELVNSSSEAASVDVALWDGASLVRPEILQGIQIDTGGVVTVDVTGYLPEAVHYTVFVTATEGAVVAGRLSYTEEGPLRLVATPGVPSVVWAGGEQVPPVQFDPGLPQRIGTVRGPSPDELEPAPPPEEPTEDETTG